MTPVLVCSSRSVASWWRDFCSLDVREVLHWPMEDRGPGWHDLLATITSRHTKDVPIAILGEHESLERDAALVDSLRSLGYRVAGTGAGEARFEWDKIWAKRQFERAELSTPPWSVAHNSTIEPSLFKLAAGTQGKQVAWGDKATSEGRKGYFEQFTHGDEYSAIVFVREAEYSVFPLVWKGTTNSGLVPPYERLRLCGPGISSIGDFTGLRQGLERLIDSVTAPCILELEFIRVAANEYSVIEVNPRIAGTTRLAAMACSQNIVDLLFLSPTVRNGRPDLDPNSMCAELPVIAKGKPVPRANVKATSRITLAGMTSHEIWAGLEHAESLGWRVGIEARATLESLAGPGTKLRRDWYGVESEVASNG